MYKGPLLAPVLQRIVIAFATFTSVVTRLSKHSSLHFLSCSLPRASK